MTEIRTERPEDVPSIQEVHRRAFEPSLRESRLVELLRTSNKVSQSLVAIVQDRVVGSVVFSPVTFVPDQPEIQALGLAPIAVLPEFQRQGIGSHLIVQALHVCKKNGCDLVVLLGAPGSYSRFGFASAKRYHLENEYGADDEFMVIELRAGALRSVAGLVKYQPEFNEAGC